MNTELAAIKAALDEQDFATARDLATAYVTAHSEEFTDYQRIVAEAATEAEAIAAVVAAVEALRAAGLTDQQYRAEAFHLHRWNPQNIGGEFEPSIRNET
ncbi:hypothetical protein [Mycobacterium phage Weirdo19]|uniref:Uncharacterized protein n=1 Tax=Mycobacterium phage Weirdo19 TaxID=2601610 RepID=A0A6M2YSU2_9CAUD|nr:hypothetical protein KDJ11_gp23 [Mycobacterium phage Weirdo19]QEA10791.1 hypothetical protein [Mycobacterium phage Weirdo19]